MSGSREAISQGVPWFQSSRSACAATAAQSAATVAATSRVQTNETLRSCSIRYSGNGSSRRHSRVRTEPSAPSSGAKNIVKVTTTSYGSLCQGLPARTACTWVVT